MSRWKADTVYDYRAPNGTVWVVNDTQGSLDVWDEHGDLWGTYDERTARQLADKLNETNPQNGHEVHETRRHLTGYYK